MQYFDCIALHFQILFAIRFKEFFVEFLNKWHAQSFARLCIVVWDFQPTMIQVSLVQWYDVIVFANFCDSYIFFFVVLCFNSHFLLIYWFYIASRIFTQFGIYCINLVFKLCIRPEA